MNEDTNTTATPSYWFVGASYGGTEDQTQRFLDEGIWENGYDDQYLDVVRSMRPGERIAIKAAYTRKHGLPFDNKEHTVSVMAIKAIGTIIENLNDGKRVRVNWTKVEPIREWYFYTYQPTIWRVLPGEWKADSLIAFAFDNQVQDINRFCNEPNWQKKISSPTEISSVPEDADENQEVKNDNSLSNEVYTVEDILKDGCFLKPEEISRLLDRLSDKKNLILQGPPGTGKTWLAKRLAFALIGQKDESKIRAVQFHPNLSYEDFVRGWRPTGEGKLSLADGVFMEAIKAALKNPSSKFVVVIEEINRGNPAQIFGELLTLLESGKRNPNEALELCYPDENGERRVHVPENLYVIGTMNIADRSLALVDLALRRRFAFVGLEPKLGKTWQDWVVNKCNIDSTLVVDIERRINELNKQIIADPRLGKQFQVGHSYVTPSDEKQERDTKKWFKQVVETEIGPLLDEYWFDAPNDAKKACELLLENW
ncbi:McrB family protein [Methylovulum miyakonense]|uniref:McrB family protein n=1 Tax=Methylovulum miyakonense TaxID=645578 RepID=UPI00036CC1A1|nr:AAA family ATPase [Methylovulum miyakonense]